MNHLKIAIHHIKNSFSERWIEYCKEKNIQYKLVDCARNDIIENLSDCDGLMWHWGQSDYRFKLFARQLTLSLEKAGKKVFPNSASCWHFDDKVGQKYLFESIGAPLVDSYVFYTKKDAFEWLDTTTFPKVFKLTGGAGSINVSLVRNKRQAISKVNTAFGRGFPSSSRHAIVKEKFRKYRLKKDFKSFIQLLKSFLRLFLPNKKRVLLPREKGYVYFQEFIPNNEYDTRVLVIGNRCFTTRRYVRKNDFRASGSGVSDHSPELMNKDSLKIAFELSEKLGMQSLSIDFLNYNGQYKICEMSYAFPMWWYNESQGYWDKDFVWHEGSYKSQHWMVENFLKEIQSSKANT